MDLAKITNLALMNTRFFILLICFTGSLSVSGLDPPSGNCHRQLPVDSTLDEYYSRWSLEQNAWDSRGGNHGLMIGGPVFVNEDVMENEYALAFDGVDDHVAISDDPSLESMEEFCLSFWVKPDGDPSGVKMLVGKEQAYRVLIVPGGGYTWVIATENHPWYSSGTSISGTRKLALDTWNHIVTGYDGQRTYLYLNGQMDTTSGPLTGRIIDNSSPLTFAKGNPSNVGYFNGTIDDVRFYKTMLSDSAIQQLYNLYPLMIPSLPRRKTRFQRFSGE